MARLRTVFCGSVVALTLAGCGGAPSPRASSPATPASAWSAHPYRIADAAGGRVSLGVAPDRSLTADWLGSARTGALRTDLALVSPKGELATAAALRGAPIDAPIAGDNAGLGAVATFGVSQEASTSGLWVRELGRTGGSAKTDELVPSSTDVGNAALASTPGGAAALAWIEGGSGGRATVNFVSRAPDGTWSAPAVLERGHALLAQSSPSVAVAVDAAGDSVVVSQTLVPGQSGLVAWSIHAGHASAPITFAPKAYPNVLRAAITTAGTAIVAWPQQLVGSDVDSPMSVSAVALDLSGDRAGDVVTLDPGTQPDRPRPGFELVASPAGGATLAWSQVDARGDQISVASADSRGHFQHQHQVIRGVAELGGLAIRDDGTQLLTAGENDGQGQLEGVVAWIRRPGDAQFGALGPVPVPDDALDAPFDTSGSVDQGTVDQEPLSRTVPGPIFDPKTGDALMAVTTSGPPTAQLTVLRRPVK